MSALNPHAPERGWPKAPLNGLGTLLSGQSPPSTAVNREGRGTVYISGPEQWDGHKVHADKWTTEPKRVAPAGAIFITVKGAGVGKIFHGIEGAIGRDIYAFVPDRQVSSRYVAHALRHSVQDVLRHAVGDIPGLSRKHILEHEIPVPPLDVQHEIVADIDKQFSRLDEAVVTLKRLKANLKRYKAAVLRAGVQGLLVPTEAELASREGRRYETGSQLLARVLQDRRRSWNGNGSYREPGAPIEGHLPSLPDGWTVASLEAITSATRVICYGILMPKENVADGVLYVKVRDMKDDVIDLASLHRTSRAIAAIYARASLRAGDLLLSIRGTYGRVAPVPPVLEGGNITQDTARLDVSKHLDASFVATFLRSEHAQIYFKTVARGVAVKGVNIGDLRPMAVPLPPLAEQQRIVAEVERRLSIVREVEAEVDANLRRAQGLHQAVLQRAFAGRRR